MNNVKELEEQLKLINEDLPVFIDFDGVLHQISSVSAHATRKSTFVVIKAFSVPGEEVIL